MKTIAMFPATNNNDNPYQNLVASAIKKARACILFSNRKIGSNFEIVNVSSATDISMSEVVEIIKKKTKRNIIVEIDKDKFR
jgi:hypothetical protein